MSDYSLNYESGLGVYALVFNPLDGTAWDGSAFVVPSGSTWADCAIALVDDGLGTYSGQIPAEVAPGNLLTQAYLPLGVDPAETDPLVGTGAIFWLGDGGTLPPDGLFRNSLVARLNGSATLAALVGESIFPQARPQRDGAVPCVVFRVPSIERDHDLDGPTGLADAYVEFTSHAYDFTDCDRVAQALRDLFDGFDGVMGLVEVTETVSDTEGDDYDYPSDGSDDGTYQIQLDYRITFRESTPNRSEV